MLKLKDPFHFMLRRNNEDSSYNQLQDKRNSIDQLSNLFTSKAGSVSFIDFISNFSQFEKVYTNVIPFIQHYGPFVKNLPTMLRLIKEFNVSETKIEDDYKITKSIEVKSAKFKSIHVKKEEFKDTLLANTNLNTTIPGPKLYI
ncbi:MAG: YqfQ-like protein [Bacillales bacterium]|jgi:hypothetical protein|nr:YqfQ-like protein [Bacillales bacterium]